MGKSEQPSTGKQTETWLPRLGAFAETWPLRICNQTELSAGRSSRWLPAPRVRACLGPEPRLLTPGRSPWRGRRAPKRHGARTSSALPATLVGRARENLFRVNRLSHAASAGAARARGYPQPARGAPASSLRLRLSVAAPLVSLDKTARPSPAGSSLPLVFSARKNDQT